MGFKKVIENVEAGYLELRQAAKVVFKNMDAGSTHYKGEYCYPFYQTGAYFYEGPDTYDKTSFLPVKIDNDMRRFINALRNLNELIKPMFSWDIEKDKSRDDTGNLVFGDVRGWCYQGHGVSTRKFHGHAALVGSIIRGVYKDAFLAELIELAKEKGSKLNKNDFMSVQAFSR
ncbi:MAG: hypothetical protein IJH65_12695 [Methanobrevibacter sp.]|nr:hypothetical protein [Methanobrevibacter sp.]